MIEYNKEPYLKRSIKERFIERVKNGKIEMFNTLEEVLPNNPFDLKIGDTVMFTNDYGVTFGPHEILGFSKGDLNGRYVYLDYDCFWFPAKIESLEKIININYITKSIINKETTMKQEDIKQTLKDKLKNCDKEVLIDIIAEICSIYVNARILSNINSVNCIQHCGNNIKTNLQEVENSITQKVKEIINYEN